MEFEPKSLRDLHEDIIFCECPRCGKSVGINRKAAGKLINCPECSLRYQVPFPEDADRTEAVTQEAEEAPTATQKEGVIVKPDHMDSIHHQLAAMQNALDRVTAVLQHIKDENSF